MRPALLLGLAVGSLGLPGAAPAELPVSFRTVALHGDPAPGTAGESYRLVLDPILNQRGTVVFGSFLMPSVNTEGIWKAPAGGALEAVAIEGELAPGGTPGDTWVPGSLFYVDDHDRVAFSAVILGGNTPQAVFGPDGVGGIRRVVDTDTVPPGIPPGPVFAGFSGNLLVPSGDLVVVGQLEIGVGGVDLSNDTGHWQTAPGGPLEFLLREGDPAPPTIPGAMIEKAAVDVGATRTLATLVLQVGPGGVTEDDKVAVFELPRLPPQQDPVLLFRSSPLPPPLDTTPFYIADVLAESLTAELVLYGVLGMQGTFTDLLGIVDTQGQLEVIALEGDLAPGTPGYAFSAFRAGSEQLARVTPDGSILFVASFPDPAGGIGEGVWKRDPSGSLSLVFRSGGQAPGFPPGVTFSQGTGAYAINRHGDLAFTSSVLGTPGNQPTIFFYPFDGEPQVVITKGDLLEVAPRDFRETTGFAVPSFQARTYMNDRREIAFKAVYWNEDETELQTGIFVAQVGPPAVAATGALAGWALALGLLCLGLFGLRVSGGAGFRGRA